MTFYLGGISGNWRGSKPTLTETDGGAWQIGFKDELLSAPMLSQFDKLRLPLLRYAGVVLLFCCALSAGACHSDAPVVADRPLGPVVDVSLDVLLSDPRHWDRKYVRTYGYANLQKFDAGMRLELMAFAPKAGADVADVSECRGLPMDVLVTPLSDKIDLRALALPKSRDFLAVRLIQVEGVFRTPAPSMNRLGPAMYPYEFEILSASVSAMTQKICHFTQSH